MSSYILGDENRVERPPRIRCRTATAGSLALVEPPDAGAAGDGRTLTGTFSVFGVWQEINNSLEGHFLEKIERTAFSKTIRENAGRVQLLYGHGRDSAVGTMALGRIRTLTTDARGAHYTAELFPSVPPLLVEGLREGRYGSSFKAKVIQEHFDPRPRKSAWNPTGLPESVVRELKLVDIGPTSMPAYPQTSAQVRNVGDEVESRESPSLEVPDWFLGTDDEPYWLLKPKGAT